jgi:hypothetical protein
MGNTSPITNLTKIIRSKPSGTLYQPTLIDYREVQHNVLGPEGQNMQAQVWGEVLDILEKSVPGVTKIARSA